MTILLILIADPAINTIGHVMCSRGRYFAALGSRSIAQRLERGRLEQAIVSGLKDSFII